MTGGVLVSDHFTKSNSGVNQIALKHAYNVIESSLWQWAS